MSHVPAVADLDLLARHSTAIFGKALSPEHLGSIIGQAPPVSGRPDWIDAKSGEIWRAFQAFRVLEAMATRGEAGKQTARVLYYARVCCSPVARKSVPGLARIALLAGADPLPPEPTPPAPLPRRNVTPEQRKAYKRAKAAYDQKASVWDAALEKLAERGDAVLRAAVVAFRARAEGL